MSKRRVTNSLVGLAVLGIFFLAFSEHFKRYGMYGLQPTVSVRKTVIESRDFRPLSDPISLEIDQVIDQQRRAINKEMAGYEYPNGKYGMNVSSLDDLLMEKGGRPTRSVILTGWRSGSTFLGDIINSHPANFYHFEPLAEFRTVQVREPPLSIEALENIEAMLKCDFYKPEKHLEVGKNSRPWVFTHNHNLWRQCRAHKSICWNPRFVSNFCRLFPHQSMKIVRLRLSAGQALLDDTSLGIRMVLLIRDPRGMLGSRRRINWCTRIPDCSDPARVCNDMVSDFRIAKYLVKKYPRTFRAIRYEDLSMDPMKHAKDLYEFYGLNFHPDVQKFLETHTKNDAIGAWSTFRNSKAVPFHWRNDLNFEEVEEIQDVCGHAMKLWGYVLAANATHQKYFNPIKNNFVNL